MNRKEDGNRECNIAMLAKTQKQIKEIRKKQI